MTSPERGETDRLLAEAASLLKARGVTLAGIVKHLEYESGYQNGCDMLVAVLPDGPVIKVTQDLGGGSDACRLNPEAIAEAVSTVENGSIETADLFILNKFGPEEAEGRGFVSAIGKALEHDVPVVVGVGASGTAFAAFEGGLAVRLQPNLEAIVDWCLAATADARAQNLMSES